MRKILVLGGSSDIGLEVTTKLLDLGWKVDVHFFKNDKKFIKIKKKNLSVIQLDFKKLNQHNCKNIILKKFNNNYDAVVNLIGYVDNYSYENTDLKNIIQSISINAIYPIE